MGASSAGFHEAEERLTPRTRDLHRAIVSLMEELEAVDWFNQRVDAAEDPELREILAHNRDEEKEHACVLAGAHRSEVIRGGGAVFSARGGDFILTVGGDLTLGYAFHDRDAVHLFCAETVTPRLVTPAAVCLLEG